MATLQEASNAMQHAVYCATLLANQMRTHGVRWKNMRKNVRNGRYAFNWLQQRLLPRIYRAPKGTYKQFGGIAT